MSKSKGGKPWLDRNAPGNRIRPNVVCRWCGVRGCVTYWGPWCFKCNVERMTRLDRTFDATARLLEGRRDE